MNTERIFFHPVELARLLIEERTVLADHGSHVPAKLLLEFFRSAHILGSRHEMADPRVSLLHSESAISFLVALRQGSLLSFRAHWALFSSSMCDSERIAAGATVQLSIEFFTVETFRVGFDLVQNVGSHSSAVG